jgi:hypothetical protein
VLRFRRKLRSLPSVPPGQRRRAADRRSSASQPLHSQSVSHGAREPDQARLARNASAAVPPTLHCDPPFWPAPVSECFGIDRGTPVDRVYIGAFLERHRSDIRSSILEVAEDRYASALRVDTPCPVDVLDIDPSNDRATVVGDLSRPNSLPFDRYECAIITQTLQYVEHPDIAISNLRRCLSPHGVLLVTMPAITRVDPGAGRPADRWRVTAEGLRTLLAKAFGAANVQCENVGRVDTAAAFLYGLAAEEIGLLPGTLHTSDYPVVVCGRAVRA